MNNPTFDLLAEFADASEELLSELGAFGIGNCNPKVTNAYTNLNNLMVCVARTQRRKLT